MKTKISIEIPGNKKKGKCWAKVINSIDYKKTDGYMFIGDFLKDGEILLEEGTVILYVGFFGSWKNGQQLAGISQVKDGKLQTIIEQQEIWETNKISLAEKCEELLNKKQIEPEQTETNQKQDPIIWQPENEIPMQEFFEDAKNMKLDYIIYAVDASGKLDSVWACIKEDFNECMFTLSNKCYFGRVQSLATALEFGFDDETRNN